MVATVFSSVLTTSTLSIIPPITSVYVQATPSLSKALANRAQMVGNSMVSLASSRINQSALRTPIELVATVYAMTAIFKPQAAALREASYRHHQLVAQIACTSINAMVLACSVLMVVAPVPVVILVTGATQATDSIIANVVRSAETELDLS